MVSFGSFSGLSGAMASCGHKRSFTVHGCSAPAAAAAEVAAAAAAVAASSDAALRVGRPSGPTTRMPPIDHALWYTTAAAAADASVSVVASAKLVTLRLLRESPPPCARRSFSASPTAAAAAVSAARRCCVSVRGGDGRAISSRSMKLPRRSMELPAWSTELRISAEYFPGLRTPSFAKASSASSSATVCTPKRVPFPPLGATYTYVAAFACPDSF
mmetsp:Transcript_8465/g.31634  ORF Transcript_8465/g.31634 Transcript_8465/m.31634 type:complete len:216 (+) Transcript_8465:2061-2708(+)